MNENVGKKRDWIKNAVIVFLVVMLVLTFFSNTIMNYSLPEVSAKYVTSGSIQAKVRGNGTVTAGDPYVVKAESTQTIASVAVNNGDHVEKGDVIFFLEEGESEELKAAEKLLDDLLDKYQQAALAADVDPDTTNKILNGQFTSFNVYKSKIDALKREIKQLEDNVKLYEEEIAKIEALKKSEQSESSSTSYDKRIAYEACVAATKEAEQKLAEALEAAATLGVSDVSGAAQKLTAASKAVEEATKAVNSIKNGSSYAQAEAVRIGYENAIEKAKGDLEKATAAGDSEAQTAAQAAWDKAIGDLEAHKQSAVYTQLQTAEHKRSEEAGKQALLEAVVLADSSLNSAKTAEAAAKAAYDAAGPDHSISIGQYEQVIKINQTYVDEQKTIIADKQSKLSDLIAEYTQENALAAELEAIEEQRELIQKLRKGSNGGSIIAPVTGTLQDVTLVAGESTTTGSQIATILPDGKGFTMEVSVTREQAQRLNVGDVADIQNSWYYSDVRAVLKQVKTDKNDPSNKRILLFEVTGDVTNGQSLSISIGQRSSNYDNIVPNSAIREDSNGKFVLIVSQKSSPLGNRYYAERIDVEVLGSDDTQSAVAGALNGWEFVITTSTKPVEAGQLIRLAD